jgi:hypothetical protein
MFKSVPKKVLKLSDQKGGQMFNTKDIKEDYPIWEDRVKYLFKLTPDNKVTRNQEIDPAYFIQLKSDPDQ